MLKKDGKMNSSHLKFGGKRLKVRGF